MFVFHRNGLILEQGYTKVFFKDAMILSMWKEQKHGCHNRTWCNHLKDSVNPLRIIPMQNA